MGISFGPMGISGFTAAINPPPNYIEDVFSTYLYTGTGATKTITNGIDLSTKGGMVWIKGRSGATNNNIFDTIEGVGRALHTNTQAAFTSDAASLTSFNTDGFTLGTGSDPGYETNVSTATYSSWAFRKQAKFFDIVRYTGNGSAQTISHNLGSVPGCIIVKPLATATDWAMYHNGLTSASYFLNLNTSAAQVNNANYWNATAPTSSVFSVGTNLSSNGLNFEAYLFASNAGGFGLTGTDNVITCGSFTTDGSGNIPTQTLGYEPQWVLYKNTASIEPWYLVDNMRGMSVTNSLYLEPNATNAEASAGQALISPNATGFAGNVVTASNKYIYIAIRRGPMKVPTLGTSVFSPVSRAGTSANALVTANFPVDLSLIGESTGATYDKFLTTDRLRGTTASFETRATFAEFTATNAFQTNAFDSNVALKIGTGNDTNSSTTNYANWLFARAPSFFDEVCSAAGLGGTYRNHNLGAVPELIIGKSRTTSQNWCVGASLIGWDKSLYLNLTNAAGSDTVWGSGTNNPTSTQFYSALNSGEVYYLFATLAGVSKVGSYTGTGASQVINCGFTSGARFVMIKRTDSTGDWYVYDTARGMVSGTDPYLFMNSLAAQVNADYVFTSSTGFTIQAAAPAGINASGGTYIFLAIA